MKFSWYGYGWFHTWVQLFEVELYSWCIWWIQLISVQLILEVGTAGFRPYCTVNNKIACTVDILYWIQLIFVVVQLIFHMEYSRFSTNHYSQYDWLYSWSDQLYSQFQINCTQKINCTPCGWCDVLVTLDYTRNWLHQLPLV